MIGRADIEGSKATSLCTLGCHKPVIPVVTFLAPLAWFRGTKGSIGHTFMVCIHTENQNQGDFYPFVLLEISVLHESPLGHLRYLFRCAAPAKLPTWQCLQPGSACKRPSKPKGGMLIPAPPHWISKKTIKVVVFQRRRSSHLCYTLYVFSQCQTRV